MQTGFTTSTSVGIFMAMSFPPDKQKGRPVRSSNHIPKRSLFFGLALLLASGALMADNPLIPGIGMCDSHVRIFGDKAYLYSGHDADPGAKSYTMPDWRIYSSDDLVNWKLERTVDPAETYLGKGSTKCYATDAAFRNGFYYFYFSDGKDHSTGVLRGTSPTGPFEDPLGKPLVPNGMTPSDAHHDPTPFFEDDGKNTPYLVFGRSKTEPWYFARLNEDMISFAGPPRPIGRAGFNSDQNFIFKRNGIYYLSFTSNRYITSTNLAGPYGEVKNAGGHGGHGSYFPWHNQWFRTTNNQDGKGPFKFRKTLMTYVHFRNNGDMVNDPEFYDTGYGYSYGVGQYNAEWPKIQAEWYFASEGCEKRENEAGEFEIQQAADGSYLYFPKVRNLVENSTISLRVSSAHPKGGVVEIREDSPKGKLLGRCDVPNTGGWNSYRTVTAQLSNSPGTKNLGLVFSGDPAGKADLVHLDWFAFNASDPGAVK